MQILKSKWKWELWTTTGLLMAGCVSSPHDRMVRTQLVTFPEGHDRVEVNGKYLGTTPIVLTLPQDEKARVADRTEIRIIPIVPGRYEQVRVFEGANRLDPVPFRLMIDVRQPGDFAVGRTNNQLLAPSAAPKPLKIVPVPLAQSPRGKTLGAH